MRTVLLAAALVAAFVAAPARAATPAANARYTADHLTSAGLVSIAVTPANPSIALGTNQQFTATGTYTDGSTLNLTGSVTWSSSAPASRRC